MTTPETMTAVVADTTGEPGVLHTTTVPTPSPGPGEVLIRVAAAGVNPVDWKTRRGSGAHGFVTFPWIPGWDVAGTVESVGMGVVTFVPGDRVFGLVAFPHPAGAYAEFVVAHVSQLARTPEGLSDVEAGALPMAALTSSQALFDAGRLRRGERVLITAASGGVGHVAVQLAARAGAEVVGVASARNEEYVRGLGAAEFIDYAAGPIGDRLSAPVDLVVDGVGGDAAREVAALGARAISIPSPGIDGATWVFVAPHGGELAALAHGVTPTIAAVIPFAEAARAHELSEDGHVRGKLVLVPR